MSGAGAPKQASLRRLREFGVHPNRELGQNFLIDDNILAVIERAAGLGPGDVVLEVGGGLGVLSEHLAPRVAHLHVVEIDPSLRPALEDALGPFGNASLHIADAVELDYTALEPAPTKVVANLPYGVAATVVLKSIEELPGAQTWVAMVQREVGERLAAAPGSKTYGATSAIAQLSCRVEVLRRVPATVFHPAPNVVSALVRLQRVAPPPPSGVVALIHAAFAHRRKALAGSLALAPGGTPELRDRAREALAELGHPPDVRAERLAPADFAGLAERLDWDAPARGPGVTAPVRERAPAKVNLVLHVGDVRPDGLHELCSLFASLELADDLTIEPHEGDGDEVVCPGVGGPNLAATAIAELRAERRGDLPPLAVTIDKRIPVAAGLGGGSADAAAVLRAANRIAGEPLDGDALRAVAARVGADVPSQVDPRHALVTGAGEHVEPLGLAPLALVLVPQDEGLSTADVYREADRIGSTRARLDPGALRELARAQPRELAAAFENDLEPAALSLRPELEGELRALTEAGALAARITGSGPTAFGVFASRADAERAAAALSSRTIVTATSDEP